MESALPDAAPDNWVDRFAPAPLRPWLKLARLDRPTGIWLLMLPGWQGLALADAMRGRWPEPRLMALFLIGAVLMRAAGCAVNDAADRDLDARVSRTAARPVAAGRISRRGALIFALACTGLSGLILLFLSRTSFWLALASLPLVAAYPLMKRITWWPQAWLGLTFNWGALLGFAAAGGASWPPALLLYASGIAWTLGYDTIYAMQDIEDDALAGVKSSARRLGDGAWRFVGSAYVASLVLLAGSSLLAFRTPSMLSVFWPAALALRWQLIDFVGERPAPLQAFRANTWVGLLVFLGIAINALR